MGFFRHAAALVVVCLVPGTLAVAAPASAQRDPHSGDRSAVAPAHVRHTAVVGRHRVRMYDIAVGADSSEATYRASAKVKALKKRTRTLLTVRQVVGGRVVAKRTKVVSARRHVWKPVRVALRTSSAAGRVQVLVHVPARRKKSVRVRNLQVVRVPAPDPSDSPTPSPEPSPSPTDPTPAPAPWRADMTENFDSLSTSRWTVKDKTYIANDSSYLTAANVRTDNGVLKVQGKRESVGGRDYTSGRIDTNGKYALPNYFRAEMRAKVPYQQGMWSAPLWFRPTGGGSGEIDLIEAYGAEGANAKVHQTIHTAYAPTHDLVTTTTPFSSFTSVPAGGWHTYTIEKTPGHIKMWVDGHLTSDFSAASASWFNQYYEAGQQWNLRVSMQIGGNYGLPDSGTNWSGDNTTMQLDYIKTWVPS